jgi:hypothetical protein
MIMGCHTWFYRKLSDVDIDLKIKENEKDLCILYLKDFIKFCDTKKAIKLWGKKVFKIKKNVENDLIKLKNNNIDIFNDYYFNVFGKIRKKINDVWYEDIKYGDYFRVRDYPEIYLFSFDETMEFIEKRKSMKQNIKKVYFPSKNWKQKVKAFWILYPNGMIHFG